MLFAGLGSERRVGRIQQRPILFDIVPTGLHLLISGLAINMSSLRDYPTGFLGGYIYTDPNGNNADNISESPCPVRDKMFIANPVPRIISPVGTTYVNALVKSSGFFSHFLPGHLCRFKMSQIQDSPKVTWKVANGNTVAPGAKDSSSAGNLVPDDKR
jgi:hypothetical protein